MNECSMENAILIGAELISCMDQTNLDEWKKCSTTPFTSLNEKNIYKMIINFEEDGESHKISMLLAKKPEFLCKLLLDNTSKADKALIKIIDEKNKERNWYIYRKL